MLEMMNLTQNELELLKVIEEGMDEPHCGWLHELVDVTPQIKGVLGSLVKKNLVRSHKEVTPGYPVSYWVQLVID